MTANGLLQIVLYFAVLVLLIKPLGLYMARVFNGERTFLDPILRPVERLISRLSGVDPGQEQHWTTYTAAMLIFNLTGLGNCSTRVEEGTHGGERFLDCLKS
jgi:K+-transporting ATPase ATPase A chain